MKSHSPEPNGRHDPPAVPEGDVAPVGVGVLVRGQRGPAQVLVRRGHDLHHVLVRLDAVGIQAVAAGKSVEGACNNRLMIHKRLWINRVPRQYLCSSG